MSGHSRVSSLHTWIPLRFFPYPLLLFSRSFHLQQPPKTVQACSLDIFCRATRGCRASIRESPFIFSPTRYYYFQGLFTFSNPRRQSKPPPLTSSCRATRGCRASTRESPFIFSPTRYYYFQGLFTFSNPRRQSKPPPLTSSCRATRGCRASTPESPFIFPPTRCYFHLQQPPNTMILLLVLLVITRLQLWHSPPQTPPTSNAKLKVTTLSSSSGPSVWNSLPYQEHKKNNDFFRVKNVVLTRCRWAQRSVGLGNSY